jgi:HNH endonuclease
VSNDKTCIYCPQTDASRFRGVEHVIPQGFGRFGSETPTLDCVCDDCNAYFGRELDQVLTRETYEGVSRYGRGQFSGEARPQRRLSLSLADATEASDFLGLRVSVDGTTGRLMQIAAQFHVHNFRTGRDEVYFLPQIASLILPEADYGRPGRNGEKGTWLCKILAASKGAHDAMVDALQRAGIDFRPGTRFQIPWNPEPGEQPSFLIEIKSEVDKTHKRAIAKILMNFIAFHLGCDEALAPRWDFLRRYVRTGEGEIKARLSDQPFWTGQETDRLRFRDDSINVRIENLGANIVGAIQFYNLPTYEMILAEYESLRPDQEIGRRYTPNQQPLAGEKRGV